MKASKLLPLIVFVFGLPMVASAHLIDLGTFDPSGNNPTQQADSIEDLFTLDFDLVHLFKTPQNDGVLSDAYFNVVGVDDPSGTVNWDLTGSGYELLYAVVKGGQTYHLYGVSLDQRLISDPNEAITVNGRTDISHVNFFGRTALDINPNTPVPDATGTLALLTFGLGLLGLVARRRKA